MWLIFIVFRPYFSTFIRVYHEENISCNNFNAIDCGLKTVAQLYRYCDCSGKDKNEIRHKNEEKNKYHRKHTVQLAYDWDDTQYLRKLLYELDVDEWLCVYFVFCVIII